MRHSDVLERPSTAAEDGRSEKIALSKGRISIYQPEQEGLIFPEFPTFKDVGEERAYRKAHLVAACRVFAKYGYDYGFAGHLTVRDPEYPNLYWTNPMCVHFAVAVEEKAGIGLAEAMGNHRAILHQNHGLLTSSPHSIDDAAWWFIALEQCCKAQLAVAASGLTPTFVTPDRARYSREHVGSAFIGWLHFQPLYDHIAKHQPDMFD
jgi:ribulose-5-phosphate 4-epimerase/fuculose-1-phosphate aldolase